VGKRSAWKAFSVGSRAWCRVIALAMDDKNSENRGGAVAIVHQMMEAAQTAGIPAEHIYILTLAMTISTNIQSGLIFFETVTAIHEAYPKFHFTGWAETFPLDYPLALILTGPF
jgi:cobalamin-dependent methionine synthase I